ncbi:IS110 family transposase [Pseudoalteromonas sp. CO342X]|uniref:IS110 family transposase n=1 Tax=Pseudoalteromonas sp. CO342X TaxID=1777270 RepID=UPI001023779E|nr:IS110 family transposase [Pseudoalteromonas sp. CO342X]RZG12155.1 IS110 family transposase [Pseudoalteromonas sp. CO342X]
MNRNDISNNLTLGVDTHLDNHVAVLVNDIGQVVDTQEFTVNSTGYSQLYKWCKSFGTVNQAGLEGTGTYGAGLCKFLQEQKVTVFEVNRPNRAIRRLRGKSDPTDAESAARSVLAKESTAIPKSHDGIVEAMRFLVVARKSSVKSKTQAINQIRALLVTAPEHIRQQCYVPSSYRCITACKALEMNSVNVLEETLISMLQLLAERWMMLSQELKTIDKKLKALTNSAASTLLEQYGVGSYVAATLLVAAGDNPERLKKESSFAALCGVSPLDASSGKKQRHRLNRGGARDANNALWTVALIRMRNDFRTRKYVEKRSSEGKSNKEIQRCLKRYIARELYPIIVSDLSKLT